MKTRALPFRPSRSFHLIDLLDDGGGDVDGRIDVGETVDVLDAEQAVGYVGRPAVRA